MGRYAFFNSGFEYKFAFGSQESSEIAIFGGEYLELENGKHTMTWDASFDDSVCEEILEELEGFHGYTRPELKRYPKTLTGTQALKLVCDDKGVTPMYTLGVLIRHQLYYVADLWANFEV